MRAISVLAVSAAICLVAAPTTAQSNNQSSRQSSRPLALSAESVLLLDTQGRVLYAILMEHLTGPERDAAITTAGLDEPPKYPARRKRTPLPHRDASTSRATVL